MKPGDLLTIDHKQTRYATLLYSNPGRECRYIRNARFGEVFLFLDQFVQNTVMWRCVISSRGEVCWVPLEVLCAV